LVCWYSIAELYWYFALFETTWLTKCKLYWVID
jgi:hypothetical protein